MLHVNMNQEQNGIEVSFDAKPDREVIEALKEAGFRWHHAKKLWYAKQTQDRINLVSMLSGTDDFSLCVNNSIKQHESDAADIWTLTRTDEICNNYERTHLHDCKEIAAIIRKHLRERFGMCKWSVRSDYNSISVELKASPFDIESDILHAIVHYAYCFANSYNYDNSDSMSDYFDVNFYGVYENSIVNKYYYEQTEMDVSGIVDLFEKKKSEFEVAESARIEREAQEAYELEMIRRAEQEITENRRKESRERIERSCEIKDGVDYFVLNVLAAKLNKLDTVDRIIGMIKESGESERENARITREVYMTKEEYDDFKNQLLDDFTFLQGMGGSSTMDLRVKTISDYEAMDKDDRESVEWFCNNCVAIFCDGVMALVIDPQGFSYARYTFIVDDISSVSPTYAASKGISEEEYKHNRELAEILENAHESIVRDNVIGLRDGWNKDRSDIYKGLIKKWIRDNGFMFSLGVIRAVEQEDIREMMYKVYNEMKSLKEQFEYASLMCGQRVTIIYMHDFGGLAVNNVTFDSFEIGNYAQYKNAVKMIFTPRNKRKQFYNWFHSNLIIVDGWIELPDSLFWDSRETDTLTIRKSKFTSCDYKQFDVTLDYLKHIGANILVNNYKPEFLN